MEATTDPPATAAILDTARNYLRAGFGVIPIRADGSKAPVIKWEPYQERVATDEELQEWFTPGRPVGIGLVCGAVSGNLAVLDFECAESWQRWLKVIETSPTASHLTAQPIVRTPGGGRHVYCRLDEGWVSGGVLARRATKGTMIEIRGQGHYVVAPGSPRACHKTNLPYLFESEGWLSQWLGGVL